jgi:lipoyl-dependent peroxiredoxin
MTTEHWQSEADIDGTLEESFPASDPPNWTLGREPSGPGIGGRTTAGAEAKAVWSGARKEAAGTTTGASGRLDVVYTYGSRFDVDAGAPNPEELLAAAHAGSFTVCLAAKLTAAGFEPTRILTTATVYHDAGPTIARIELATEAEVPGLDEQRFQDEVATSARDCPISKALSALPAITVSVRLA